MSTPYEITNWYWKVGDQNPTTHAFSSASMSYVLQSDGTYVAWLAQDGGNTPTTIALDSDLATVFDEYNATIVFPRSDSKVVGGDIALTNPVADYIAMVTGGGGFYVTLPVANPPGARPIGRPIIFADTGSFGFGAKTSDGTIFAACPADGAIMLIKTQSTTTDPVGTWTYFILPVVDPANASNLSAGKVALARGGTNADLSATGGTSKFLKQASAGADITVAQPAAADLSDGTTGTGAVVLGTAPTITTINLSGGQIAFPATQAASAGANTLDDYEEGTWTPTVSFATPGTSSFTYSTQSGAYTKIGDLIYVKLDLTFNPTIGTGAGNLLIGGIPFSPATTAGPHAGVMGLGARYAWPAGVTQAGMAFGSATAFAILGGGTAINPAVFTAANCTNGLNHITQGGIVYKV